MQVMMKIIAGRTIIEIPVELSEAIRIHVPTNGGQSYSLVVERAADNSVALTPLAPAPLDSLREKAANRAFARFDFDVDMLVNKSAWKHQANDSVWSRKVTLENEGEKTREVTFVVHFAVNSDKVTYKGCS